MYIVLKISKFCNLRCNYCYEYNELSNKERMPLDGLEYFFQTLAAYTSSQKEPIPIHLVIHGGEPLLLPHNYLQAFCNLRKKYLDTQGIVSETSVQSNLFKISDKTLDLIQDLDIKLGVSLDVFGEQRIDITGKNSQEQVLNNIQRLLDRNISFGCISVLHALNADNVVKTYHFYNELGISYRILPIFRHQEPTARMQNLLLTHEETVAALQKVAKEQFSVPSNIEVLPLQDYFMAALRHLTANEIGIYDPFEYEWALIINTNGDAYTNGDCYLPDGFMGNIFRQSVNEIITSEEHKKATVIRMERAQICRQCEFDRQCEQLPLVEATQSERSYDAMGKLQCKIAKPMIQFMVDEMQNSPHVLSLLKFYKQETQLLPQLVTA